MYKVPVISLRIVRDGGATESPQVNSPSDIVQVCMGRLASLDREATEVVHLDTRNRVIAVERVALGALNSAGVEMREVFKGALLNNAAAIIIVHNHPSGNPTPSTEDITFTETVIEAGELLGIPVLDHIVVAADGWVSMKECHLAGFD